MIEINLIEQKKAFKMPVVLGFDLAEANIKGIIFALIISILPDFFVPDFYAEQMAIVNGKLGEVNKEISKIQREIKANQNIKVQLDAFNQQVERLKKRSKQVDQIIKTRTNPKKILERVARNIPEDVWLETIEIKKDRTIVMQGGATSYKSIGDFITLANESAFFGNSLALQKSSTVKKKGNGRNREESFTVKGKIETFDPDMR